FRDYAALSDGFSSPHDGDFPTDSEGLLDLLARLGNDLEPAALQRAPVVGDVLQAISAYSECRLNRMSGSGATCFGLFGSASAAGEAADRLAADHGWWTWAGPLARAEHI